MSPAGEIPRGLQEMAREGAFYAADSVGHPGLKVWAEVPRRMGLGRQ